MAREGISQTFTETGLQYYVAGRFAALAGLVPVAGNLHHHAIEMLLKAGLITTLTEDDLKSRYGHKLNKLWTNFKGLTTSTSLNAFDDLVNELDRWETLRYFAGPPVGKHGTFFCLPTAKTDPRIDPDPVSTEYYHVSLEEIDELFSELVRALDTVVVIPGYNILWYVRWRLSQTRISEAYRESNNHVLS